MSNFIKDLRESQNIENNFKNLLKAGGINSTTTQSNGRFDAYDIIADENGVRTTFEIKFDKASCKTNNVAVELYKEVNGQTKDSGLAVTKADFYAYHFPNNQNFYLIEPCNLKKLVDKKKYKTIIKGGDSSHSVLALFDAELFKSNCILFNQQILKSL